MKTYVRLFWAGSIGAVLGGGLVHYAVGDSFTVWSVIVHIFGLFVGAFAASCIVDRKGTIEVCKRVKISKAFSWIVVLAAFTIPTMLWVATLLYMGVYPDTMMEHPVDVMSSGLLLSAFGFMFYTWAIPIFGCLFPNSGMAKVVIDDYSEALESSRMVLYWILASSPIGIFCFVIYLFWEFIINIKGFITTIFMIVVAIPILVLLGLTKCRLRLSAMGGAAVGMIIGFFWWNPIAVAFIGGASAAIPHWVANHFTSEIHYAWRKIYLRLTLPKPIPAPAQTKT